MAIWSILAPIASALIGGVSANRASNAQERAGELQYQLGQDQLALQREIYDGTMRRNRLARDHMLGIAGRTGNRQANIANRQHRQQQMAANTYLRNTSGLSRDIRNQSMRGINQTERNLRQEAQRGTSRQMDIGRNVRDRQLGILEDTRDAQVGAFRPYTRSGRRATNALNYEMGLGDRPRNYAGFQATPGYEFRMQEGTRAIDNSAAAQGGLFSGRTGRALTEYGQGIADQEYDSHLARLAGLSSQGLGAAGALAAAQGNYGAGASNAWGNYGVGASGAIGSRTASNLGAIGNAGAQRINTLAGFGNDMGNAYGNFANMGYNAAGTRGANLFNARGAEGQNRANAWGMFGTGAANAGTNYGSGASGAYSFMGNALANQGDAQAAGAMGWGNALNSGVQNVYGMMNFDRMMKLWTPQSGGA